jgi:hypothetical protein
MYLHVDGALEKCKILGGSESPPPDKYSYNCQTQLFDILYPLNKIVLKHVNVLNAKYSSIFAYILRHNGLVPLAIVPPPPSTSPPTPPFSLGVESL